MLYRITTLFKGILYANALTLVACMRVQLSPPPPQVLDTFHFATGANFPGEITSIQDIRQKVITPNQSTKSNLHFKHYQENSPVEVPLAWGQHADRVTVGRQFVGPLPVGIIEVKNPELHLLSALNTRFALTGRRPVTTTLTTVPKIQIIDLSLNAYDLIVSRKITCSTTIQLDIGPKTSMIQSHFSSYHDFAFAPEMSFVLKRCLSSSADKIMEGL